MEYAWLKLAHQGLALVSVCGFCLRWSWRMAGSRLAQTRMARILPHLVDTLFLGTALALVFHFTPVPYSGAWLTAKVGGLVLYIVLGAAAMRSAPDTGRSLPAFIGALLAFGWIVSVAVSKSPWGFLGWMGSGL